MGVQWRTIGMSEPDLAQANAAGNGNGIGSTVVMDFATVVLVFWWGFRLRKNVQAAVCEMGFVLTAVALSEYVHATMMSSAGCEQVLVSHRIACGYTACISTSSTPGYEPPGDRQWWVCLLYTSPSPRDRQKSRMPSSA